MLELLITVIGIVAIVCFWVILYDTNRFIVVPYTVESTKIKKPYRAVILSDLHNKKFGRDNERLVEAIDGLEPDGVIIAGDMLTAKPGKSEETAISLLKRLSDKYPVYYGNGNHEHRLKLYPEVYGNMAEEYESELAKLGIRRLVNAHTLIPGTDILVYGLELDKFYFKRFKTAPMPEEYLNQVLGKPGKGYRVLIAHNPDYFPQYAGWGADLVLSGHIHGGMIRIPFWRGVLSPAVRLFPKYDGGKFVEDDSTMLLSRGLGVHTIPIRMFNPAELLVVDFKSAVTKVTLEKCPENM